jgi:adenylate cyclase
VVGILDEIFTAFDERAISVDLEKIKTIGDAYMMAGGLHQEEDPADAARRVVAAGVDFFGLVEQVNRAHGISLGLRVGVHSGPIIAGVIGRRRLSYDLWGDTVNLASRMESHGVVGHLQLSGATLALVGESPQMQARGSIEVKGHGPMETWLISVC